MMKVQMKKLTLPGLMIALLSISAPCLAARTNGVAYGKHNLSKYGVGQFKAIIETQVCVFCHVPHNGAAGQAFLWNRNNPDTAVFYLYTATPYIDNATKSTMVLSEISKMCMSCHDGATALNSMANPRGTLEYPSPVSMTMTHLYDAGVPEWGDTQWGANIGEADAPGSGGGVLVNDHPVSFNYENVRTATGNTTLRTMDDAQTRGVLFWSGKVECVTCHDPHINYNDTKGGDAAYRPFLRRTNASSGLCFACHNK